MINIIRSLFICLLLIVSFHVSAQDSSIPGSNNSGGSATISGYSVDWSIGTATPIELLIPSGAETGTIQNNVPAWKKEELNIKTISGGNNIMLQVTSLLKGKIQFTLFDETGRQVLNKQSDYSGFAKSENISLASFPKSNYFLRVILVSQPGTETRKSVYKILKN